MQSTKFILVAFGLGCACSSVTEGQVPETLSLLQFFPNEDTRSLVQDSDGSMNNLLTEVDQVNFKAFEELSGNEISDDAMKALVQLSQERAVDNTVILVYHTYEYRENLLNWLAQMNSIDQLDAVVIASLSTKLHEYLVQRSLPSVLITDLKQSGQSKKELWLFRTGVTARLLKEGQVNVLLSDVDAMHFQPVLPYLKGIEGDIVASRAGFPTRLFKEWGATVCMGFALLRASLPDESIDLWKALTLEFEDDQQGINRMLERKHLVWDQPLNEGGAKYATSVSLDRGQFGNGQVISLLSHSLFQRQCIGPQEKHFYVKHCIYKRWNPPMWNVPDDWESIPFGEKGSWLEALRSRPSDSNAMQKFNYSLEN